jgi:hypothetical protein
VQKLLEARLEAPMLALIGWVAGIPGRASLGPQQQTVLEGFRRWQLGLLLDKYQPQALAALQLPFIELGLACENPKKCRLTGTVATDQTQSFAGVHGELRSVKEGPLAEGHVRIEEGDQRHKRILRVSTSIPNRALLSTTLPRVPKGLTDVEAY